MDVEMRGTARTDPSEAVIRQRLANVVKYFNELDSSRDEGGDTECETTDDREYVIEENDTGIQRNGQQDVVELPSVIHIGPERRSRHSTRRDVSTLPSESRGKPATPNRQGRLHQHSPTSLQPNGSNQVQREVQVYYDRVPSIVEVSILNHLDFLDPCVVFIISLPTAVTKRNPNVRIRPGHLARILNQAMRRTHFHV